MADIKISQLSEAQLVSGTDVFPMTSNGVTMKAPASAIKDYMGVTRLATDIVATRQMIASIESNPTSASQSYAIGAQFILNGLLCEATTAITQGAAFVLNGNYKLADSVTGQLGIKKYTMVSNIPKMSSTSYVTFEKYWKIVVVTIYLRASETISYTGDNIYLCDIPSGFIPSTTYLATLPCLEGDVNPGQFKINSTGKIEFYIINGWQINKNYRGQIVYFI